MTIRSICIVGLDDYALLSEGLAGARSGVVSGAAAQPVNGESVQHVLLAHAWRELGLDVSLVVYGSDRPLLSEVDGIRIIAAYQPDAGMPLVRFAYPRATDLIAALRRADADVYYQSPSGMQTGITAWFCRRFGRKFVHRVASDVNCIPGKQLIRYWRDRKLYEYGVRRADLLAVQTHYQRRLLLSNYARPSEVVNMAVQVPQRGPRADRGKSGDQSIDVLWVSNFRSVKRPELALELAQLLPGINFTLVGGSLPGAEAYFESVTARARTLPNVTCLGAVPYEESERIFDRAALLLNTSEVEGFPNTFLQAWIRGLPVVTFFDPDNLVKQKQLGRAVTSLDEMTAALEYLLDDAPARRAMGERARAFALAEFSARGVAGRYLELLEGRPPIALRDGTTG